jgi:hypothetical protein
MVTTRDVYAYPGSTAEVAVAGQPYTISKGTELTPIAGVSSVTTGDQTWVPLDDQGVQVWVEQSSLASTASPVSDSASSSSAPASTVMGKLAAFVSSTPGKVVVGGALVYGLYKLFGGGRRS